MYETSIQHAEGTYKTEENQMTFLQMFLKNTIQYLKLVVVALHLKHIPVLHLAFSLVEVDLAKTNKLLDFIYC